MRPPRFSVVVPAHRRPDALAACVRALAALDYPDYEVVVVDDGSPRPLAPAVEDQARRLSLTVHRQANTGPAGARNTGARLATGDLVAFTDDDCRPHPEWLSRLAEQAVATPGALLAGRTRNALPGNLYSAASQTLVSYLSKTPTAAGPFYASNNIAMPREAFLEIGGFDTSYPHAAAEDRELCARWSEAGRPMAYVPRALVDHAHPMGLRSFVRQHATYGRGAMVFHAQRASRKGQPHRFEPARFYLDLLLQPFRDPEVRHPAPVAALLAVSQAANAAGYAAERVRRRG